MKAIGYVNEEPISVSCSFQAIAEFGIEPVGKVLLTLSPAEEGYSGPVLVKRKDGTHAGKWVIIGVFGGTVGDTSNCVYSTLFDEEKIKWLKNQSKIH
jgi:hypothetical protein